MAEEPTLPLLPAGNAEAFIKPSRASKRVRLDSTPPPISSDPPLFSSDDDPSAENYLGLRRRSKKKFRGPWFSQKPDNSTDDPQMGRRRLQRQFDSAVWLGSDGTEGDEDAEHFKAGQVPVTPDRSQQTVVIRPASTPYRSARKSRDAQTPEELARTQIELCLETGKADLDLSARGLTHISNALIKPLATFVPVPDFPHGPAFQSLRPALKIFLSANKLQRIPGEICNLEGLRVLSLRNNEMRELPSRLGQLKRIVELNLANNSLHYLPYEILELLGSASRLHSLQLHPNPFYQPDLLYSQLQNGGPTPRKSPLTPGSGISPVRWNIDYRCRSQVRFLDISGNLIKGPRLPDDHSLFDSSSTEVKSFTRERVMNHIAIPCALPGEVPEPPRTPSADSTAPSLLELAVRAYTQTPHMPDLGEWLGSADFVPDHLSRVLKDAQTLRETEAGDRRCTICNRIFIIPRTEWIEWWEMEKDQRNVPSGASPLRQIDNQRDEIERLVPLMRRGCSWKCLPS